MQVSYVALACTWLCLSLGSVAAAEHKQPDGLLVDLSTPTGPVLHGASGWLYGQAAPGIPTINMMEPLRPQIAAQKPEGGLQHPMGDAFLVAPDFRAAGGKLMQIYMQDIYPDWPYNNLGIDEYLRKVDVMTRQVMADPNHDLFVYVPFNEPNNNWYADSGPPFAKFLQDWLLVYRKIRSIDPGAKIAGPGFEHYNAKTFETFLAFARDNHALPDEFTWHELHDDFYPQWYRRVDQYRATEVKLGLPALPIVINEYVRDQGDLSVPGNLVQWVSRLENSKVYGCLAFWTPSGTLADLTARIWPNRPTGAWWLYRWYGSMTGETVAVTPPDRDAVGLQGIAALDRSKQQLRMIFGGTSGPIRVDLRSLDAVPAFGEKVHVSLASIGSSGIEPSGPPETILERNETVSGNGLTISVPAASPDHAYLLIVTPAVREVGAGQPGAQELLAVEQDFTARARYDGPDGSAVLLRAGGESKGEYARFIGEAAEDGYYALDLRYHAGSGAAVRLKIDDEAAKTLKLDAHASHGWGMRTQRVFLSAGIHRFRFEPAEASGGAAVEMHSLTLERTAGSTARYEAEAAGNLLGGSAYVRKEPAADAHHPVAGMGQGVANFLEFRGVMAQKAGKYAVVVAYANDEKGPHGQVDERTEISVNGGPPVSVWFRNTFSDKVFATAVIQVQLQAGENQIRFGSAHGKAPIVQSIEVAPQAE